MLDLTKLVLVEVINEDGTPRYSDKGEPMSVNELVAEYLKNNPHHVLSTPSGAGSKGTDWWCYSKDK
jgi:hypothetical protein